MENSQTLSAVGISKRFGGLLAVNGASLDIVPGEIHGLIGPNGAGKSTMIALVSGALKPTEGRVYLGSTEITNLSPPKVAKMGVARTFQRAAPLPHLSVLENILVGLHPIYRSPFAAVILRTKAMRSEALDMNQRAIDLMVDYGLYDQRDSPAGELTFGQLRFLEIARAIAKRPAIVLLDEPAAGLNAVETQELARLIRKIRDSGAGILLVDHDVPLVFGLSDRMTVLDSGTVIAAGSATEVRANPEVRRAYLGEAEYEHASVQ